VPDGLGCLPQRRKCGLTARWPKWAAGRASEHRRWAKVINLTARFEQLKGRGFFYRVVAWLKEGRSA